MPWSESDDKNGSRIHSRFLQISPAPDLIRAAKRQPECLHRIKAMTVTKRAGRGMSKHSVEIRCDACNGSGLMPARDPEPGRRTTLGSAASAAVKGGSV